MRIIVFLYAQEQDYCTCQFITTASMSKMSVLLALLVVNAFDIVNINSDNHLNSCLNTNVHKLTYFLVSKRHFSFHLILMSHLNI